MKAYHWRDLIVERERLARLAKGEPAPDAPPVMVNLPPRRESPAVIFEPATVLPVAAPLPRMPRIVSMPALPVTTPGRSVCMECLHYARRYCTNPRARHPVSGEYVDAMGARKDKTSCGPTGRYWDPRPAKPRALREHDDSEPMQYVPPVPVRVLEPFIDGVVAVLWQP